MPEFNTTLLREKFVITDQMPATALDRTPVIAVSNRMVITLSNQDETIVETFTVRAQNMHSCARMAAQIAREFHDGGPLLTRTNPFNWDEAWQNLIKGYEKKWNSKRWIAIYHKGRPIYEEGEAQRHPFLDIIEQCDARNKGGSYEKAIEVAQDAFRQAGKMVTIKHDSNVALVMNVKKEEGKCGLIIRAPSHTMTFNIIATEKFGKAVTPSQMIGIAAAFLEGIQLAFFVGNTKQKLAYDLITPSSPEAFQCEDAGVRIGKLNVAIAQLEATLDISYRPEKPNFTKLLDEAQAHARKSLMTELARRNEGGEGGGWVL